jgi:predicted membrane protein
MFLIACGLLISFRSNFRNAGGFIMILVGGAFLIGDIIPNVHLHDFIWPGVLILIGIIFILRPRVHVPRNKNWQKWQNYQTENINQPEYPSLDIKDNSEFIEINAVFGGVKKIVLSKNFRGGEINTFMGGAEINLQQADIKQVVSLEVNNVFGGTKIVIPSNWDIKNEVTAVFGGVEDKRSINLPTPDVTKAIILRGTCVFGGIEIKNF